MSLGDWLEERAGFKSWLRAKKNLPIPKHVNLFYCFGGITLVILLLQVLSGFFMLFYYVPKPQDAFESVLRLSNEVPYGWFVRSMHRWGATLIVATLLTHLFSVFYHRAFQKPRELNWLTGVAMFLIVWLFLITGAILPWNWRGYWVLVIWTDYITTWPLIGPLLEGPILNTFTVGRSYVTHVWLLPLLSLVVLFFHFKMVRRHGISGPL
ncbi:MAG TPA: cytochrome b6 [Deltaproteobacteria bacterium]|nr:cytochrome b6 [Deltaproteobacteria bacterium]